MYSGTALINTLLRPDRWVKRSRGGKNLCNTYKIESVLPKSPMFLFATREDFAISVHNANMTTKKRQGCNRDIKGLK